MNRKKKKFRRLEEKGMTTAFINIKEPSDSLPQFSLSNFKVAGGEYVAEGRSGCLAVSRNRES